MTQGLAAARPRCSAGSPLYQWETARGEAPVPLRLFGVLGRKELARVTDALLERCRSHRDFVCVDFEEVEHLDYRALPEFTAWLTRCRDRGASIGLVGLSPYLRALFHVAGEGPALRRLEWLAEEEVGTSGCRGTSRY